MYCSWDSVVKSEKDSTVAHALKCRSWLCPNCMDDRKRQLIAEALGGNPNTFMTLTIRRRDGVDPEDAVVELVDAFRKLRKRALREGERKLATNPLPFGAGPKDGWKTNSQGQAPRKIVFDGKGLPFIAVVEKHKSGWPHLHVLLRSKWLDHEWLRAQMIDMLDSPVIGIERIWRKQQLAGYCGKYCSKAAEKFDHAKRYWKSRDYERRPDALRRKQQPKANGWEIRKASLEIVAAQLARQGYAICFHSRWKFVASRPEKPPDD